MATPSKKKSGPSISIPLPISTDDPVFNKWMKRGRDVGIFAFAMAVGIHEVFYVSETRFGVLSFCVALFGVPPIWRYQERRKDQDEGGEP